MTELLIILSILCALLFGVWTIDSFVKLSEDKNKIMNTTFCGIGLFIVIINLRNVINLLELL